MAASKDTVAELADGSSLLRILHISDTHGRHRSIELKYPFPSANIILHTGDFTDTSSDKEFMDFNNWCGELKERFEHIIVIAGNHEYSHFESAQAATNREYIERRLTNNGQLPLHCKVLEHETFTVHGLRIFGSSWVPWHDPATLEPSRSSRRKLACWEASRLLNPHTPPHYFDLIPPNTDILMTHGPPYQILDSTGNGRRWGGSKDLLDAIYKTRPTAHVFGHLHEQRGIWYREEGSDEFKGGVEFQLESVKSGSQAIFDYNSKPPPADYPIQVMSCNAMLNNYKHERAQLEHDGSDEKVGREIAAPARLIVARREGLGKPWVFRCGER